MTGATGFLGSELAAQLRLAGHDVVALVRDPSRASDLQGIGAQVLEGDLADPAALDRLLEGADGFFHLAGWYRHGRREHDQLRRTNVDGTRRALEAARRSGVPRTVYTSTLAVNSDTGGALVDEGYRFTGRHLSEYDRTKAVAHDLAKEHAGAGLPLVITQPSAIYGPGDMGSTLGQLVRRVVENQLVVGPRAGGAAFTYVADAARGHVLAMEAGQGGESYILAGPTATYEEFFGVVARLAGTRPPRLVPPRLVELGAWLSAPVETVLPLPQFLTADAARSAVATYYGTAEKAQRELGWSARGLQEGIAETVAGIRGS
jgi:nucleoside-diphosphate-sugar epimerase